MKRFAIADLCDDNRNKIIQVLSPNFKNYGGKQNFHGQIKTIKLNKSNFGLIDMLKKENGKGKVIVVDVDEAYYGVVGDKLSLMAEEAEYEALIINGYVRDVNETKKFNIALYALGTCPLRNFDKTDFKKGVDLNFGNVNFKENSYIYCDEDGIIISNEALI